MSRIRCNQSLRVSPAPRFCEIKMLQTRLLFVWITFGNKQDVENGALSAVRDWRMGASIVEDWFIYIIQSTEEPCNRWVTKVCGKNNLLVTISLL